MSINYLLGAIPEVISCRSKDARLIATSALSSTVVISIAEALRVYVSTI